jgi:hypothetical protein
MKTQNSVVNAVDRLGFSEVFYARRIAKKEARAKETTSKR